MVVEEGGDKDNSEDNVGPSEKTNEMQRYRINVRNDPDRLEKMKQKDRERKEETRRTQITQDEQWDIAVVRKCFLKTAMQQLKEGAIEADLDWRMKVTFICNLDLTLCNLIFPFLLSLVNGFNGSPFEARSGDLLTCHQLTNQMIVRKIFGEMEDISERRILGYSE